MRTPPRLGRRGVLTGCCPVRSSRSALLIAAKSDEVVRADELDLARGEAGELPQVCLIGASLRAVDVDQRLEPAQALRRSAAVRLDLGAMEIGVAAMEQPIVLSPDRDAAMPARVTGKRHQQHLVARPGDRAHGRKAKPGFALFLDRRPFPDRGDLHGAIAVSLVQARPVRGRAKLGGENVDRSVGKIA